ncbi:hypothetical protein J2045_003384 [Peteryoungia aggregata LMG 23059]|uniref:Uncharacterized protein n=1 Tax=Peteryoungia aggregata LMG 23059 TaxID=1368425 RepID=A0ABU0GAF3_9HYPH|nr:hypothetical protein [Peteryoungia aggregata LMG 23059]
MGLGPAPPPPPSDGPSRPFKVKDIQLGRLRRNAAVFFYPSRRAFVLYWENWVSTRMQRPLTAEELPEYLTNEEIARCLAAAITASATP